MLLYFSKVSIYPTVTEVLFGCMPQLAASKMSHAIVFFSQLFG